MKITTKNVEHVAHLAQIKLDKKKIENFTLQFNDIVNFMTKLSQLKINKNILTEKKIKVSPLMRKDKKKLSLDKKLTFKNAPQFNKDFFIVPKIIKGDQ